MPTRKVRRILAVVVVGLGTTAPILSPGFAVAGPAPLGVIGGGPQIDAKVQSLMTAHKEDLRAQAADRATPAARERRLASRSRFKRMTAADALGAASERFTEEVGPRRGRLLNLPAQARVARFLDDRTAVVEQTVGGDRILSTANSLLPLRDGNGSEAKELVDFTLEARTGGFAPRNPLVETRLPGRLADGFGVGDMAVRPLVRGDEGAGQPWEDSVFYGNVDADTDVLLKPIPAGVELFHQLRSPDAPEQLRVELDLPDGVRAEQAGESIELKRGDEPAGRVSPVFAVDAGGVTVPATMTLEGQRLLISVAHRGADVEYPILVDPAMEYYSNWGSNNSHTAGWSWWANHSAMRQYFFYGLHHIGPTNTTWLNGGHISEWYYTARPGARVYKADWQFASGQNPNGNECHYLGFYNPGAGAWTSGHPGQWCYAHGVTSSWTQCATSTCTGGGSDGNMAVWGSVMLGSAYRNHATYDSNLANATLWLQDTTIPTITPNRPGYQTFEGPAGTVRFTSRDTGVGMKKIVINHLGTGVELHRKEYTCAGTYRASCLDPWETDIDLDSGPFGTGTHTVRVQVWDNLDNYARYDWVVTKTADTTRPVVTLGGTLNAVSDEEISEPSYDLSIDAYDPLGAGSSGGREIVSRIRVIVDQGYDVAGVLRSNLVKLDDSQACSSKCTMHRDFRFTTDQYPDGPRTITVEAYDAVGNVKLTSLLVYNVQQDMCLLTSGDDVAYCNTRNRDEPTLDAAGRSMSDPGTTAVETYPDVPVNTSECQAAYPTQPSMCIRDPWEDGSNSTTPLDSPTTSGGTAAPRSVSTSARRYGIADQHVEALQSSAFTDLKVKRVRVIVPYNIMTYRDYITGDKPKPSTLPADRFEAVKNTYREFVALHDWVVADARNPKLELMISFEARQDGDTDDIDKSYWPTEAEYVTLTQRFRNRFPKVKLFSAWNEPNNAAQPTRFKTASRTGAGPRRAALYANKLHERVCKRSATSADDCRIVAGEFLDVGAWRRYMIEYRDALNFTPPYWAIHPYVDVKRDNTMNSTKGLGNSNTQYFVSRVPTGKQLWITEVGSRVDNGRNTEPGQTAEVNTLLSRLAGLGGGFDRLYYYHVCEPKTDKPNGRDRHDSGLLNPTGDGVHCNDASRRGAFGKLQSYTLLNPFG